MRAMILVAVLAGLLVGCEKTIKDVKSDRPGDAVALQK